jgi:hypothetical protein
MFPGEGHSILPTHRRYLIGEQGLGSAIINFIINGAIAWAVYRSMAAVPTWGEKSIAGDTVVTAFLLPFMICLIVTPLTHRKIRNGEIPVIEWRRVSHRVLGRLPNSTFLRAFIFGLIGAVGAGSLTPLVFSILGITELPLLEFLIFKSTFAAVLAGVVTPVSALCALGDACDPEKQG